MTGNIDNFEKNSFNPYLSDSTILNDIRDPDINFFDDFTDSCYFKTDEINGFLSDTLKCENMCVTHVNIRSLKKNYESLRNFLNETKNSFNIICITETWCSNEEIMWDSTIHLSDFDIISLERKSKKTRYSCTRGKI